MKKRISVIIQARMGSSRLPGKVFKKVGNKIILQHVIDRVGKSKYVNDIIVATTDNENDNAIYEYCQLNAIKVFRGSENDVLDRYYMCAKLYQCDNIVRITSDCPLHDASIIDKVIDEYINGNYEYASNTFEYTYPDGMDTEVFSFKVLEKAWKNAKLPSEREHVTPYIRYNNEIVKKNIKADKKYPICRLTLDCEEDLKLITEIYNGIGKDIFSLDEIISFLEQNKELIKLNEKYCINEGYEKSLKEDLKYLR